MRQRDFGGGQTVSALGFGAMRLPTTDGDPSSAAIDEPLAVQMIRTAIEGGVDYVDTAYPYHGGRSEVVVGQALAGPWRARVRLVTKCPVWLVQRAEDFDRYLDEQLRRLQTDHLDAYLLHALDGARWRQLQELGLLARAEAARADGRIGRIGFSFHGPADEFRTIVDGWEGWDLCQIQYNYLDVENQAGTAGLRHAAARGLAVAVMEPLLGGRLANPPPPVRALLEQAPVRRSPVEWALHWLWDQPEVGVVLSGMSTLAQVEQNLTAAAQAVTGGLTPAERAFVARLRQAYQERALVPCTKCGYCKPCPSGVDIPRNLELFNDSVMHEDLPAARSFYQLFFAEDERAHACSQCGACLALCPQQIDIPRWLMALRQALDG